MNRSPVSAVTFTLRLPASVQQPAKELAKTERMSLNSLIVRLLEREIAQKGQQP